MKKIKPILLLTGSFLAVFALALLASHAIKKAHAQGLFDAALTNTYTVSQHTKLTPTNKSAYVGVRTILAHYSDGSYVTETILPDPGLQTRDILDVANQLRRKVYDEVSVVSTSHLSAAEITAAKQAPLEVRSLAGDCLQYNSNDSVVDHENMLGIPVVRIQTNDPAWMIVAAPSLNCAILAQEVVWGPPSGASSTVLDSASTTPPDPSLLVVPAYYTEMSPSLATQARYSRLQAFPQAKMTAEKVADRVKRQAKRNTAYAAHQPTK